MLAITFGFTLLGDRNARVNGGGPNLTLRGDPQGRRARGGLGVPRADCAKAAALLCGLAGP
jgi:hypothetical protein